MSLTEKGYMPRLADRTLSLMLETFGAVCVEGPRACGKTWTSLNQANSVIRISDPADNFANRALVSNNVEYAFRGKTPHLIDEWQEFPSIWDATRMKVDKSTEKGRFILTGSSTPVTKGVLHSGAGRIGSMRMRTMSLFESKDSDGSVSLESLFNGSDVFSEIRTTTLEDIIDLTLRGGWPMNLGHSVPNATLMNQDYLGKVIRDASKLDGKSRDENRMRMFVRSLSRNESTIVSNSTICDDISEYDDETVSEQSISSYTEILTRMFIIENQPAFSVNPRSPVRVGKKPKRHLTDPSLAAAAMGLNREKLMRDLRTFGYLFESLCVRDLGIYAASFGGSVYHYHDDKGREADAVVETPDGRWGAFEIKTGTDRIEEGATSLKRVEKLFDDQGWQKPEFLCVICGTAPAAYRRSDGVYVVPVTCLGP